MRPIWKGSISFGLVYIPVAVYPATREEKLSFRQLRSTDLSPIKYKKVAEADAKEVAADQIVKGFEYERGRYVVLKDEDFEKVRIESTHSIDITDFVEVEQIDPKFFYTLYFPYTCIDALHRQTFFVRDGADLKTIPHQLHLLPEDDSFVHRSV